MKVVFVSQHFDEVAPPLQNSVGIWTYEVARRLAADGDTTIVARRPSGAPSSLEIDGIRFDFLTCAPAGVWLRGSRLWRRAFPRAAPLFARRFYAADFLLQAALRVKRLAPDVVHIQNFPQYAPAIRRVVPNAAIVLHMHCDWLVQLDQDEMERCIAAADLVAGCSEYVTESARKHFAGARARFVALPNGTPVDERPRPRSRAATVLFVGRLSPEKGLHTLLEAWPKVVAARSDARLEIVGPPAQTPQDFLIDLSRDPAILALARFYPGGDAFKGPYVAALRSMIPPELEQTVTFVGYETHADVIDRFSNAAILVNPSLSESFGMSLVEALACGTPVVATRVGGMSEIVEATGGGVLVAKDDPDALATAIIQLLSDPDARGRLGQRGAERVTELYHWPQIAAITRKVHEQALSIRQATRDRVAQGFR